MAAQAIPYSRHEMDLRDDPVLVAAGVTRREAEVLAAIGRRLTNHEIADALGISVRTVESHVAGLRAKLHTSDRSALRTLAVDVAERIALPVPARPLVGRDTEVAAITTLLDERPLVTLVGPGGCGKSSVAGAVASRWTGELRIVDLVPLAPGQVDAAVADALGIGAGDTTTERGRTRLALAGRRVLLVLDNCEHVAGAVADRVDRIIGTGAPVRILATGRQRLELPVETVVALDPLALPEGHDLPTVRSSPACRLFAERAASVRSGFRLDASTAAAVATICARVDGLPLAIELAAAGLRALGVDELAALLDEHAALTPQRGHPPRHRTVRAAIAWSWSLLDAGQRALLCRFAALPSDLTLDELTQIDHMSVAPVDELPLTVAALVDRSMLVARGASGGPVRYGLLETIRTFALAAADAGEVHAVRHAAARAFRDRLVGAVLRARAGDIDGAQGVRDRDGAIAALTWAAAHDRELACDLLVAVAQRFELDPSRALLDAVRDVVVGHAIPDDWPSGPLAWAGALLNYLDLDLLERCGRAAATRAVSDEERALAAWVGTFGLAYAGATVRALGTVAPAEAFFDRVDDRFMVAHCRLARGLAHRDPADAAHEFERCMLTFLGAGAPWHANAARLLLVRRALEAGIRSDDVVVWLEACTTFAERRGLEHDRAHAVLAYATYAASQERAADSAALAAAAADMFRRIGDLRCLGRSLLCQADAAPRPADAVAHGREAVAVAVAQGDGPAQHAALQRLAGLAEAAGDRVLAAQAIGAAARADGRPPPTTGTLARELSASVAEGHAAGATLIAADAADGRGPGP